MALLSLNNAQAVDMWIYIIAFVIYLCIVWVPCLASYIIVKTYEPVSMAEFKFRWWKFKRQYIYLEIWFRTHVLLGASIVIILFAEPWNWFFRFAGLFVVAILVLILRNVARLVKGRIPGDVQIKSEFTAHMKYHKTSRGEMNEFMRATTKRDAGVLATKPVVTKKLSNGHDYVQTNSATQDTMKKQIELGTQQPGTPTNQSTAS